MTRPLTTSHKQSLLVVGVAIGALAVGACALPRTNAASPPSATVSLTPIVSGTLAPAVSLELSTTAAPVTEPAATAPPPTDAPTTTAEVITTEVPTTTTLSPNLVSVGAFPTPIPVVGNGDGPDTAVLQMRLTQLGFWNGIADGKFGLATKQSVMAFQKYVGIEATGLVDEVTAANLTTIEIKAHGQADAGTLIEVDKARQLLFVTVDGKTNWVFNASTGNGLPFNEPDKNSPGARNITGVALTPDGLWKVNRQRPEGWWEGDLGDIYRPKYFHLGIAVHGAYSVPNYPASHGCVRVSVPAMNFIWDNDLMPMKMVVWVHG